MGDVSRKELSTINEDYINKERFYELRHFCRQYPIWVDAKEHLSSLVCNTFDETWVKAHPEFDTPVERCAEAREGFAEKIKMVEMAAKIAGGDLWQYLLMAVTEGMSYNDLYLKCRIPCSRDVYYKMYRKFFAKLNRLRN